MAYRRRQGVPKGSTLKEEIGSPYNPPTDESSSSSLAAKAIRASSAYRDSSISSAYGHSAIPSSGDSNVPRSSSPPSYVYSAIPSTGNSNVPRSSSPSAYGHSAIPSSGDPNVPRSSSPSVEKDSTTYGYTSMKNLSEPKHGFWGVLARKAKAILDDDNAAQHSETPGRTRMKMSDTSTKGQYNNPNYSTENRRKADGPAIQKGLDAIASSLNYIGGTIGNAFEEGLTVMENRTADIIQETRKLQIRKKGSEVQNQASAVSTTRQQPLGQTHVQPQMQTDLEIQLKASRDVAMAMAAKAKLLLRELKTVKADLAFAKERCAQLEEENRILRESHEKGDNPEDDDLIRLQLETLLAEKARLAQENSVFARENRFLREIVEYHQLTMQDVVYLDEKSEEVSEVYPIK